MNRLIVCSIVCLWLVSPLHAQKKSFTLQGDVAELRAAPRVILIYIAGGKQIVDSVEVKDGKFRFTGSLDGPTFSQLLSNDYTFMNTQYIENSSMSLTQKERGDEVVLTGSSTEKEYTIIKRNNVRLREDLDKAMLEYEKQSKTDSAAAAKKYHEVQLELLSRFLGETSTFVKAHPKSIVSVNELGLLSAKFEPKQLQALFASLDKSIRQSPAGKELGEKVGAALHTQVGAEGLDFTQKDRKGENFNLSSLRGKYVLIDFWASWCGPCRAENPNLVKVYQEYHNRGFEIVGVSLDQDTRKWNEAIKKDSLSWVQVSDLKGWGNDVARKYGVVSVPANYLLDPNGVIVAKGLRGQELRKKLDNIFQRQSSANP